MPRREKIIRPEGGKVELVNPDAGTLLDDGNWDRSQDKTGFWG